MLNIAIIILNWENSPATLECARSVLDDMDLSSEHVHSHLWIVDNGSSDQSADVIKNWVNTNVADNLVTVIENPENAGFSAGMNKGIFAAAKNAQVDYFWLLNNDLTVETGSLIQLSQAIMKDPAVAIWGPTVIDAATFKVQCAGGCIYYRWLGKEKRAFAGLRTNQLPHIEPPALDYIYGAAMLIKKELLDRLHGLNEDYFLYYEELDLVEHLNTSETLGWCQDARVVHQGGDSSPDKRAKVFAAYHAALSAFKYTWRYHPLCLPSVILFRVFGLPLFALRYKNPRLALAPFRALRDFLRPAA